MGASSSICRCLLFLLLLSGLLLVCYPFSTKQPLCQDEESASLLQLKESLVTDSSACDSSKLSSWQEMSDCCSWDGIECDNNTRHVIGLDLANNCLYGSINSGSTLFRLVHLTSLNLAYNNFNYSTFPPEFKNLSKILELSNLITLDLLQNPLLRLQKPSLKDLVETLTNLTELYLSGVTISSTVPQSIANLSSLSSLYLIDCGLLGKFPSRIFQLPNLRVLILTSNPGLTGHLPEFQVDSPLEVLRLDDTSFSGQIPDSIGNLKSLNTFVVRGCRFSGPIPSSIGNLTKFVVLDLSSNIFSGQIPSSLGNLLELTYLSLSENNFSSGTLSWPANLTNLSFLDLVKTNLYGEIPSSVRNLTKLTLLLLYSNKLTGPLPSWLGNLTQLTVLQLSDNKLQGPIPNSIFKLPYLQVLELQYNQLNGSLSFDSFLNSTNLDSLQLSRNHLSLISSPNIVNVTLPKFIYLGLGSCNLSEFPFFLRGQNDLQLLELSHNRIEGLVPYWISDLATEGLRILNLNSNFLTGFEQSLAVLQWKNLLVLNLTSNKSQGSPPIPPPSIFIYFAGNNRFNGEVSSVFCNLISILVLDLSNNNLSGSIPQCLGNLSNTVSILDLHNNTLSGNIPNRFTSDCALRMMDFSQNKLEGKIPRSLVKCTKLESLHLGTNQIRDIFPSWLGILPELRMLILRDNGLVGALMNPEISLSFPRLKIIDLSDNNFSGKLPLEYFKNWVAMKSIDEERLKYMQANISFQIQDNAWYNNFSYSITMTNKGTELAYEKVQDFFAAIDFSCNRFEGVIAEEIANLKRLQLLNLSNNILSGQIPASLGNMIELQALDLSVNQLSEEIPVQLAQLTFLAFFNVSQNNLTGPIPRGNQFGTFQKDSFAGNSGLCGFPLSKGCGDNGGSQAAPSEPEESESSFEFDWTVVLIGYGSGLFIGIVIGFFVNIRKHERVIKKFLRLY